MQIREQGKQVQLIRSPYDPAKKRCVQKVAHTFERQHSYLSDDVNKYLSAEQVADLSDDEKKTLSAWLKVRADKRMAYDREAAIRYAHIHIISAADAISSDGVSADQAAIMWEAMDRLGKSLKKAGHPKSAFRPPAAPAAQADQAPLPLEQPSSSLPPGE